MNKRKPIKLMLIAVIWISSTSFAGPPESGSGPIGGGPCKGNPPPEHCGRP